MVVGYKAKAMLLKQNYDQALELYQSKLSMMDKLHWQNNLELSQINQGLAIVSLALGQKEKSKEYNTIAERYQNLADANKERTNCFLSLVPSNCELKDQ